MPARTPLRHESQRGSLCRGLEDRPAFLEELRGRVGRSALDAGRYGSEALLAFLGGLGKPVEELTPADLERFREAQRRRVEVGELRPLKAQAIQQGARFYLRFLARQGRLDEGLFFFELFPHPRAAEPELSERARRLMEATECLSVGVSPARAGQYRRGAMLLLLFLERQGCRLEDMDEGRWLAFRRELMGEEKARLSTTALANDPGSRLLTGARAFLRLQAERGRLRPEQVPQSVMPIEASRRQPRGGLPGGVARLARFLERRGKDLAGLTAEDLRAFIDEARATRGDQAAWLLESIRAYLRQQARAGRPLEPDLVPLAAPGSFDEQRALYLLGDASLAPLFTEAEDFARFRKAQGYLGEGSRLGAFRLLLFLRLRGLKLESLTVQDWHAFAASVGHQAHLVEAGRAYARSKAVALPRPERKPFYPELPAGLAHLPRLLEDALRASDLSELTRPGYRRALRDLLLWLKAEGIGDLTAVTREVLTDYRLQLQTRATKKGQPYAAATQSSHLVGLRFFFSWLFQAGHLLSDPSRHLPYPRPALLLPRTLKSAEIGKLLRGLPKTPTGLRDRALLELLYGTGLRRAEIARLTLEDLDLEARTLLVRQGKGHKDRLVPLGKKAKEALLDYLDLGRGALLRGVAQGALFLSYRGTPLRPEDVSGRVRQLGRGVKLRVWPHLLRHTCATHLLRGKADIRHIQRLLGHKSLQTTERYTRVEVGDLRRVIERCHPREKQRT